MSEPANGTSPAETVEDLAQCVKDFINWISDNEYSDPENMLVCAEWYNLCSAVGSEMIMAGTAYAELNHPNVNEEIVEEETLLVSLTDVEKAVLKEREEIIELINARRGSGETDLRSIIYSIRARSSKD